MSYVYVIRGSETRHKIGRSNSPQGRLANLQIGSPEDLELVFFAETPDARAVEAHAHNALRNARSRGEWFDVTQEIAVAAVREGLAGPDPEWTGWTHGVGDRVVCRIVPVAGWPGQMPRVGESYTISAVDEDGRVDVAELDADIWFCPSDFWPAGSRLKKPQR